VLLADVHKLCKYLDDSAPRPGLPASKLPFDLSMAKQVWSGKMDDVINTIQRNIRLV